MEQKHITLIDTTLRDGLQHEEHYMSLEHRLELLNMLIDAGVKKIEVGSFAHPVYLPQFRQIDDFALMLPQREGVEYTFLALNRQAAERAVRLKAQGAPIHRVLTGQLATSEAYARKNMNRTHEELFREAEELVQMLHEGGIRRVAGNVGTIWGCPIGGKMPLEKAYDFAARLFNMGFDEIEHADTEGTATPEETARYCSEIMRRWPDPSMHVLHIHDVTGMGLASYYAAMKEGICQFEATLGGIGGQPANSMDGSPVRGTGTYYYENGRTGLVSLEDFAAMLARMGYETGVDLDKLVAAGRRTEQLLNRPLDSFVVAASRETEPCSKCECVI